MTIQGQTNPPEPIVSSHSENHRERWTAGAALIGIGLLLLIGQFIQVEQIGQIIMLVLTLIFLAWGIATRNA